MLASILMIKEKTNNSVKQIRRVFENILGIIFCCFRYVVVTHKNCLDIKNVVGAH